MPKLSFSHLVKPTPKKWRQIGNALLSIGGSGGSFAFVADHKIVAYTLFGCAVLGKLICELTTTDNEKDNFTGGTGGNNAGGLQNGG